MRLAAHTSWPRVFALYACGVGAGMQFAKTSVLFDALRAHYDAGPTLIGWFVSSVGLVGLVFGATAGLVVARIGFRRTLIVGLGAGALLSFAEALLPPAGVFLGLRVVEGVTQLAIVVAGPTCLTAAAAGPERPLALGLWSTFMSVAFLIGGAVAPPLAARYGLAAPFVAHGALLALLTGFAYIAAPRFDAATTPAAGTVALIAQHIDVYANARTSTPAICFLAYTAMYLALQTLTPELAPPQERPALFMGMAAVSIVASLVAGALAHRGFSPYALTIWAFALTGLSSLALQTAVGFGVYIGPAALLRMAFLSLLPGAILPMIPSLNPTSDGQARAFGALAQTGNVGSALGPPIFAASEASLGTVGLLAPALAFCVAGAAFAARAGRRSDGR